MNKKYSFLKKNSVYKKVYFGNKKAYSVGFTWIFGLVSIFGIGLLFIVFDQVFVGHIVPVIKDQVDASGTMSVDDQNTVKGNIDKYMDYWHFLPYVLFFVVIIYMIMTSFRKEGDQEFL